MGVITCPPEYPAKAPSIRLYTENGRFVTTQTICLSISDYHPESWNPAWKVSQIIIGLLSFWLTEEYTYGAAESYSYPQDGLSLNKRRVNFARNSRESVLKHAKFIEVFTPYAEAIGINQEPAIKAWVGLDEEINKLTASYKEE